MFGVNYKGDRYMDIKTDINGTLVSTVRLPIILSDDAQYETCIFWAKSGSDVVARYSTPEEAEAGHNDWVDKVRRGVVSERDYRY
jgi:hypothetical protein